MPFLERDDPEQTDALRAAFHRVCDVLRLDYDKDDATTELIAMKIMEHATAGELDPERLCIDVLAELELVPPAT